MEIVFSLIAGLAIAFALQLLLANLGIALGLTVLDFSPSEKQSSGGAISLPVTHLLGFSLTLTLSSVLFFSGLLTVEFSEISQGRRGLIFGIILWAAYWLLFIWLSSTTLSAITDSLLGTAFSGGRRLISAVCQRIGAKPPKSEEQTQLNQLTEDVSKLAKQQEQLPQRIAQQQEALLAEIEQLMTARQTAPPEQRESSTVVELETASAAGSAPSPANLMSRLNLPSGRQLLRRAVDKVDVPDLSDIDIQDLWHQLRSGDEDGQDVILLDVADYLQQTPAWIFQTDGLKETFCDRIYDPDAAPEKIKAQLIKLDRTHLVDWLQARGDLAADQIEAAADQLSQIKDSVMAQLSEKSSAPEPAAVEKLQTKLIAYCRYTNLDLLTPENLIEKVHSQLEDYGLDRNSALQLDFAEIEAILHRRQGLEPAEQKALMKALEKALPQRSAPRRWAVRSSQSAKDLTKQLAAQVTHYLQHQDKAALKPIPMAQDLAQLVKAAAHRLPDSLPNSLPDSLFDKSAWQQALEKRRDMTAEEIQQVMAGTESLWQQTLHQIGTWTPLSDVQETLKSTNDALSQQLGKSLVAAQETLETQVDAVKTDLQVQADAARKQVAIASWWLFSSLLLSGVSAATAGWLAVRY